MTLLSGNGIEHHYQPFNLVSLMALYLVSESTDKKRQE